MMSTVAHRRDTVAMICRIATVARPVATRSYMPTVADRCDLPHTRGCVGACARGDVLRTMGTVVTVCDGKSAPTPPPSSTRHRRSAPCAPVGHAQVGHVRATFAQVRTSPSRPGNRPTTRQRAARPRGPMKAQHTLRATRGRRNTVNRYSAGFWCGRPRREQSGASSLFVADMNTTGEGAVIADTSLTIDGVE